MRVKIKKEDELNPNYKRKNIIPSRSKKLNLKKTKAYICEIRFFKGEYLMKST